MTHEIFNKEIALSKKALKAVGISPNCGNEPPLKEIIYQYYRTAFSKEESKILTDDFIKQLSKEIK